MNFSCKKKMDKIYNVKEFSSYYCYEKQNKKTKGYSLSTSCDDIKLYRIKQNMVNVYMRLLYNESDC